MKEVDAIAWRKMREAGLLSWIVKRGILGFGLPLCLVLVIPGWIDGRLAQALAINIPVCLIGGILFGLWMWRRAERQYRHHVAEYGPPSR